METLHHAVVSATVMHTAVHKGFRQDSRPGILYFNITMVVCVLLALQSVLASEMPSLNTVKGILCLVITNKIAEEKVKGLAFTGTFSKMKHTEPVFLRVIYKQVDW